MEVAFKFLFHLPDQQSWGGAASNTDGGSERKKKRKSRWGNEEVADKTVIPGMPTVIPANISKEQEKQYLCKFTYRIRHVLWDYNLYLLQDLQEKKIVMVFYYFIY